MRLTTRDKHDVPSRLDVFVGRRRELSELGSRFARHRLLTLVGPGGIGKTRLALRFAEGAVRGPSYPDGVQLIELASLTGPHPVLRGVAVELGIRERHAEPLLDTLLASLRDKRILLVLDNCEHLIDECAALAESMLNASNGLRVLATSREALRLPGEGVVHVEGLPLPRPDRNPASSEAVQLFAQRARVCSPGFELTPERLPAVAAICSQLDGLPLAVELAARRTPLLSVQEILDRLSERFALLTVSDRTAEGRHRSLGAAIDWSHDLLSPAEQKVFRRLSVFTGDFGLAGATAVCAGEGVSPQEMLDLVTGLEAKSMVVSGRGDAQVTRFRLLESMRSYGLARLQEAGEPEVTAERLAAWLADLARPLFEVLVLSSSQLGVITDERDNLQAAWQWAMERGSALSVPLAAALSRCRREEGQIGASISVLDEVLGQDGAMSRAQRGFLLAAAAGLAHMRKEYEWAWRLVEETSQIADDLDDDVLAGRALQVLGLLHMSRGDLEAARQANLDGLAITRRVGTSLDVAVSEHNVAWVAVQAGDLDLAAELLRNAVPVIRDLGTPFVLAHVLHTAGVHALATGDLDRAETSFSQALHDLHTPTVIVYQVQGLAVVASARGQADRAVRLASGAQALHDVGGTSSEPGWQARVDHAIDLARAALGAEASERASAEGASLPLADLVTYAVTGEWTASNRLSPLSEREHQVARLVADGLTNRQIAAKLHVAERTVATYLEQIRHKLNLQTRIEVALWATRETNQNGSET